MVVICPCCGAKVNINPKKKVKKNHKRLPNGFGQISEIKGQNLRKKFRVMVTVGKDETGKPISKLLKPEAYFSTYNEAYQALVKYNQNPIDLTKVVTVKELYDLWYQEKLKEKLSTSRYQALNISFNHLSPLHDKVITEVRRLQVMNVLDTIQAPSARILARKIMQNIYEYAVKCEFMDNNPMQYLSIDKVANAQIKENYKGHKSFTDEEMGILWQNINDPVVQMMIIQCYTGFRPQELCTLNINNVNLTKWEIVGGMKTDNGINRTVPIHQKIRTYVEMTYNDAITNNREYLFKLHKYKQYYFQFQQTCKKLGISMHSPHDARVQFVSMCKKYNVDEYAVKKVVGHSISDITEKYYTKVTPDWIHNEIGKIN